MTGPRPFRPTIRDFRFAVATVLAGLALAARAAPAGPMPRTAPVQALRPGDRILCLYDSTEGTTRDRNPLSGVVARTLAAAGLDVAWHDVAAGLPDVRGLRGLRAVVTGFEDAVMTGADDYPRFVRAVVDLGVRFVIIGNYGAYQDRSGAWVAADRVNAAFEALGVRYEADWTDDPSLLSLEVLDPALGAPGSLDPAQVRHYYRFAADRPDVRVQVASRRTDRPSAAPSAVVFTASTGAMALGRHLSAADLLDDAASAGRIAAFVRAAVARVPADPSTLLIVHDPESADSRRAVATIAAAAAYAGIPLDAVALADARTLRPADLAAHAGVVLAVTEAPAPLDAYLAGLIRDDLAAGGRVAAVLPLVDPVLSAAVARGPAAPEPVRTGGLRLRPGAFPGVDGLTVDAAAEPLTTVRPSLAPDCVVLAESSPADRSVPVPLWWRCPAGRGATVGLNAYEFADRAGLGLVAQALLQVEGAWAMPVLAAAVEFVDDCPLPMTGATLAAIGKPDTDFYRDDFYATVREAALRLHLRPTFLAVFSYEDRVRPPFGEPFAGGGADASRDLARRIVADDFPLGLHGMNHMSPALAGGVTAAFPDRAALAAYMRAGHDALRAVAGARHATVVYVPPNDWIDRAGKEALVAEIPEVRVLSAVFDGTEAEMQQDFAPDPDVRGVVDLPRTWAGEALAGDALTGLIDGVMLYAVSTHFVHPDDVLDPERSGGRPWPVLRAAYLAGLEEVRRRFPFLREMTAAEAGAEVARLDGVALAVRRDGDGLVATRTPGEGPIPVLLRLAPGCRPDVRGGAVLATDPASGVHVIRMDARVLAARCGGTTGR